jgi:hypothetical protein
MKHAAGQVKSSQVQVQVQIKPVQVQPVRGTPARTGSRASTGPAGRAGSSVFTWKYIVH